VHRTSLVHHVQVHLRDDKGKDHLVLADMGCRNTVFNAQAQSGAYYLRELAASGYRHFRVELVDEPAAVVAGVLQQYQQVRAVGDERRAGGAGDVALLVTRNATLLRMSVAPGSGAGTKQFQLG
jgi:hypothetical protein